MAKTTAQGGNYPGGLHRKEEDELGKHLEVLLTHMLKHQFQPSRRTRSWDLSIKEQRIRVRRMLAKNPSLRPKLQNAIREAYGFALIQASRQTHMAEKEFPQECPYTKEEILPEDAPPSRSRKARNSKSKARTHKGRTK